MTMVAETRRASSASFTGFSASALDFLKELESHNDRNWFRQHGSDYRRLITEPACALITSLAPLLSSKLGAQLRVEPRPGGSLLRPQRDARFTPQTPYRPYLELWFWEGEGPSRLHPGYFLRVAPTANWMGAGLRSFPPETLAAYRRAVDEPNCGLELARLLRRLEGRGWQVDGPNLSRVPTPYPQDHERAGLLRHTGLVVQSSDLLAEALFVPELPIQLVEAYRSLKPLHRWLVNLQARTVVPPPSVCDSRELVGSDEIAREASTRLQSPAPLAVTTARTPRNSSRTPAALET